MRFTIPLDVFWAWCALSGVAVGASNEGSYHLKRADSNVTIPAPIVVTPSQYFEGVDGDWSTFNVRVGTPEQSVRVLVSTNSPATFVVVPGGCSTKVLPEVPSNCVFARGGTFNTSESTTWNNQGFYGINGGTYGFEANLGHAFNAQYGLDNIGLGYQSGVDGPTLRNQTLAGYALPSPWYTGMFGVGVEQQLYESFGNYSAPSFFKSLDNEGLIPGLSWSYTAGASYRLSAGQYAQLIFGGHDTSRYQSNSVDFQLSADVTRDIVVAIQSISYTGATTKVLLETPIYAFIESTDPNIWLPESACVLFEEAFGIVYDNTTEMYLMNKTHYTALAAADPSVTFRLANGLSGGSTVDISLPFSAFGLSAAYPFVANASYYFPLKRAINDTQYTLGRAFLQEAYLTVDYDRRNFSVSQCTWIAGAASSVTTIPSPRNANASSEVTTGSNPSDEQSSTGKSVNAAIIAGPVIGVLILVAIIAFAVWRWRKHRRAEGGAEVVALASLHNHEFYNKRPFEVDDTSTHGTTSGFMKDRVILPSPLSGRGELYSSEIYQLDGESRMVELRDTDSGQRSELPSHMLVELDGESDFPKPKTPATV